ncbi:unnamed protein product, partial [Brenthis ino]
MNEEPSNFEAQAVAGPSGEARKRKQSSVSSTTSSSSSSSSSSDDRRKNRRRKYKKSKRAKRTDPRMDKLLKEMGELRQIVSLNNNDKTWQDSVSIYPDQEELCEQLDFEHDRDDNSFSFEIETKLKEPSVPKTPDSYLKMLSDVQRFGSTSWSDVRYAETQKLYNHTPGFTDLETNDEVKMFDNLRHLAYADKAYAAITYCILKQKISLQEVIRNLISWAKNTNSINVDNLGDKVDELFLKGDLFKISSDLLQLVCGHRAESIEMRRETITSQVRDPLVRTSLNKIPPSTTHLFDSEAFSLAIEKSGGVRKVFWPPKNSVPSQARVTQMNHRPSRGQNIRKSIVPSRGAQCNCYEQNNQTTMHLHGCNNPPSRGEIYYNNQLPQYPMNVNQYRGSFQNRGSRPGRGSIRGRGNSRGITRGGHNFNKKQ